MSEKQQYPSDAADRFLVRMPDGMRERIAEAAKATGRSMNAEIVARLQDSFIEPQARLPTELLADLKTRLARVERALDLQESQQGKAM